MLLEGPDLVIADEAHEMKNPASLQCKSMLKVGGGGCVNTRVCGVRDDSVGGRTHLV